MGANATTFVPAYVAGEVLTAANLSVTNSGIPVFATTVTRDAAFGGTGEKTLAEGQFAYIEATNTTQYYDGAAWQSVGVNPGLVCVKAETAFTSAASITADNVFTSAYSNYRLVINTTSAGNNPVNFRLRVGGVSASTNYNRQELSAISSTAAAARTSSATSGFLCYANGALQFVGILDLFGPQLAQPTQFFDVALNNGGTAPALYTSPELYLYAQNHSTATAYDGIEILSASNLTGVYSIYGYSKTV
jgi:hypothetical protein